MNAIANPVTASAPGRVNLIGEHTDYNNGLVLPTPIPLFVSAELERRADTTVDVQTIRQGSPETYRYDVGAEVASGSWADYVMGVTWVLRASGFPLRGFSLSLRSDIPAGSGLASSAALEVSIMRALREAFELRLDDVALAELCRRAEVEFVGAKVGIMDQMAASVGRLGDALFLDTSNLEWRHVPLPKDLQLLVIHSGITHSHASGDYNQRWAECQEACRTLHVSSLRGLSPDDLSAASQKLPPTLFKRARHVVTENSRVVATVNALERNDLRAVGELFRASHASMRDDYDVSLPEIDALVELANGHPQVYGARLTGGGFGGSIIVAAKRGATRELADSLLTKYKQSTGRTGEALVA